MLGLFRISCYFFFFFFFSSRRRHTRSDRDWSSDVCSSDLVRRVTPPPTIIPTSGWKLTHVDRKSTRLNSSHDQISYAVFCLKKKKHPLRLAHNPDHFFFMKTAYDKTYHPNTLLTLVDAARS